MSDFVAYIIEFKQHDASKSISSTCIVSVTTRVDISGEDLLHSVLLFYQSDLFFLLSSFMASFSSCLLNMKYLACNDVLLWLFAFHRTGNLMRKIINGLVVEILGLRLVGINLVNKL